ncbi:DUF1656 domain-containing protein [Oceanobacter mangrovi]|uniref:DUF1656 domain-containing protein n=1 Tax=Oceanobacter mangrovi TaxID=2862510 RepID=UPI001FEC1FE8|nr:DUF1656 domain-containing protein [Oceanobacter mangrovi]
MPAEFSMAGIYLPRAMVLLVALLPVFAISDRLLLKSGVYRWIWHPALARMGIFITTYSLCFSLLG